MSPLEQLETMMNSGVQIAGKMIEQHGGFLPYGMILDAKDETRTVSPSEEMAESPPEELVEQLNGMFRKEAEKGELKATALFVGVTVQPAEGPETEAIMVCLEHRDGECLNVYTPYTRSEKGELSVGEMFVEQRKGVVF